MDSPANRLIQGLADKRTHSKYLLGIVRFFFVLVAISARFYQGGIWHGRVYEGGGFAFQKAAISNLGNPILNPGGWILFSIAMIGAGILFLPHVLYLYRAIRPVAPKFAKVFAFLLSFTPIGMIGAGIINEDLVFAVHYFLGGLYFGGIGLAAIFCFFFSLVRFKRRDWHSPRGFAILYGIIVAGLVYLVATAMAVDTGDPRAMHLPEWVILVTLLSWLVGFYLLIPANPKSSISQHLA